MTMIQKFRVNAGSTLNVVTILKTYFCVSPVVFAGPLHIIMHASRKWF